MRSLLLPRGAAPARSLRPPGRSVVLQVSPSDGRMPLPTAAAAREKYLYYIQEEEEILILLWTITKGQGRARSCFRLLASAQKVTLDTYRHFFLQRVKKVIKGSERGQVKVDENLLGLGACVDSWHLPTAVPTGHIFPWKLYPFQSRLKIKSLQNVFVLFHWLPSISGTIHIFYFIFSIFARHAGTLARTPRVSGCPSPPAGGTAPAAGFRCNR